MRRYGHDDDASRLAKKFVGLVTRDFERTGTIVEKYDVERGASDVAGGIRFGYAANQAGFGWTNGVYLELLAGLEAGRTVAPRASAGPRRARKRAAVPVATGAP